MRRQHLGIFPVASNIGSRLKTGNMTTRGNCACTEELQMQFLKKSVLFIKKNIFPIQIIDHLL